MNTVTLKGMIRNGVAMPLEPIDPNDEGRSVIITFVDHKKSDNGGQMLKSLIDDFKVDAGIEDLAAQHDHYLYGTPKK